MPHIKPLSMDESATAKADIEWLASATGFVASAMLTLARRSEIATAGGRCPASATAEHMAELRKHFTEEQVVEIGSMIALFGFSNRWNAFMGTDIEPEILTFLDDNSYTKRDHRLPPKRV